MDRDAAAAPIFGKKVEMITRVGGEQGHFAALANLTQGRGRETRGVLAAQVARRADRDPYFLVGQ